MLEVVCIKGVQSVYCIYKPPLYTTPKDDFSWISQRARAFVYLELKLYLVNFPSKMHIFFDGISFLQRLYPPFREFFPLFIRMVV